MTKEEEEYLEAWVWPSKDKTWYCRALGAWFPTCEEAVAAHRRRDAEAGIVWPWQRGDALTGKE